VIDPVFKNHIESKHPNDKDKIYEYVSKHNGSCQGCDYLSKADQKVFKVASDIEPMRHLDILEATSMKTSLSVSKTINLPSSATPEDISKIYLEAYKRGIIGVTVYRDGCREGILVHETNGNGNGKGIERKDAPKRPENLECDVHRVKVGKDHLVVLAGKMKGKLYEVFVAKTEKELEYETGTIKKVKRNHYDFMVGDKVIIDNLGKNFGGSVERTLARFVSMSLRSGVALTLIVEQLTKGDDFFSFDIAVSRVLKKYIKNGEVYEADVCDVCKSKLIYYDGCIKCSNCTWSKCG
jgi:ribonucleoside-diphosphate reductase alpha chain